MYLLKQCRRCNGDLTTGRDRYGQFISCLQCGLCEDIETGASGSTAVGLKSVQPAAAEASSKEGHRINNLRPPSDRLTASVPDQV